MPSQEERKKAIRAYKEKEEIGGLFRYVNTVTGWQGPLQGTPNLEGIKNRFQFSKKTNSCFDTALAAEWAKHGADAFELVAVEQLKRKPDQTLPEFREELEALLKLYQEEA